MKDPAWRPVLTELRSLYDAAGRPSYRAVGARAQLSHTTVHNALTGNGPAGLSWLTVRRLAEALGGDGEALRPLYDKIAAARPTQRAHWSLWRQDVVTAAWAVVSAQRSGDRRAAADAVARLDALFARRP